MAKVLVISPDFPPPFVGGSLIYVHNLMSYLSSDADILTAPLPEGVSEISIPHKHIVRKPFMTSSQNPGSWALFRMYMSLALWILPLLWRRTYPVIVLNISAIGNGFFSALIRLFGIQPVIIAYGEEITLALNVVSWKGRLKQFWVQYYTRASLIVCVCDFVKTVLVQKLECREDRFLVIPTPLFAAKRADSPSDLSQPRIISVGRLIKRKGFDWLIRAFAQVVKPYPTASLVIVGHGPEYDRLLELISELELSQSVSIRSGLSDAELAALYHTSRVFVLAHYMLPNGDCEGCPNVLVEASASGLPVIGGVEGGASSVVIDGETGYLVDPTHPQQLINRMLELVSDTELASRLGRAGIQRVKVAHDPKLAGERFSLAIAQLLKVH